jgi:hypothetical protein
MVAISENKSALTHPEFLAIHLQHIAQWMYATMEL